MSIQNILTISGKISDLEQTVEELQNFLFQLCFDHEIKRHERELEDIIYSLDPNEENFEENIEYINKQAEIAIIKHDTEIAKWEDEYERLSEHLVDGKKYFEKILEDEYNSMTTMLENFHL